MFDVVSRNTIFTRLSGMFKLEREWPLPLKQDLELLVEDNYVITVGHVPKFLTKLTFFFLKNGSKLHNTVIGPRRYSVDLKQSGLELPADFCFTSLNEKLLKWKKMKEKTLEEVQKYEKQKKEVQQEKENKRKRNWKRKNKG